GGDTRWTSWAQSIVDASRPADELDRRLRSALGYDNAVLGAVFQASDYPVGSPYWDAWAEAAQELAERSQDEISLALDEAHAMRNAISMEHLEAMMILARYVPKDP
ncbi:hypothetical protein BRADI_3g46118v3, partial [Brachypodium distachyon]